MSLRQPLRWTYYRLAGVDEADILDNNGGNLPLKEMRMVAGQLKPMLRTSDEVFFWGNHVGIFPMIGKLPATISLTNTPLSTAWTPQTWKDKLYGQLTTAPPHYMIIEKRDLYPFINGSDLDSRTRWFADERLRSFTDANYDSLFGTSRFDVYKKR